MSIPREIHDCYAHYELKTYVKLFKCDGCKIIGFGERYACNFCGRELHKECRHPKETISHKNFGGSIFKFLDKPFTKLGEKNRKEFSKCCFACGMDICGFNYHCEEDNLDLHPCCMKLERKSDVIVFFFDRGIVTSVKCRKTYAAHCYKKTKQSIFTELFEQEQNLEQAINYYGRAADLFQSEDVATSANQCKQKIAQFAAQLQQYQKSVEIYEEIAWQPFNNNLLKYAVNAGICQLCMSLQSTML